MTETKTPRARKIQLAAGLFMMVLVGALAVLVALHGQDVYMQGQGYYKTCSPVGEDMVCQYCRCPDGVTGGPGFGGGWCEGNVKPQCERAD